MAMNEATMSHYLENIPNELVELTKGLDSKPKWAIYAALLENKKMFFNQIKDEFGANPTEVDRILKSLGESGLIIKRAKKFSDVFNDNRTYYEPSLLGEQFFGSAFNLVIPKKSNIPKQSEENKYLTIVITPPSQLAGIHIGAQQNSTQQNFPSLTIKRIISEVQ